MSRFHAVVYFSEGKWWVMDMNSSNGIIVDGQNIHRHQLNSHTQVRLGSDGPILNFHIENNVFQLEDNLNDSRLILNQENLNQDANHEQTIIHEIKNDVENHNDAPKHKEYGL